MYATSLSTSQAALSAHRPAMPSAAPTPTDSPTATQDQTATENVPARDEPPQERAWNTLLARVLEDAQMNPWPVSTSTYLLPMQFLGPVENGLNASRRSCLKTFSYLASLCGRNLSGWNSVASAKLSGLVWMLSSDTPTIVPPGTSCPATSMPSRGATRGRLPGVG